MAKKKFGGSGTSSGGSGSSEAGAEWRRYLPEQKDKLEERYEELKQRKGEWHGLIVPGEGEAVAWVVQRLTMPPVWVVGGVWLLQVLRGLEVVVVLFWLMPLIAYGLVAWKQRHSSGEWLWIGLGVMALGLVLGAPGLLAVLGV